MTSPADMAAWLRKRAETADAADRHNLRLAGAMVEGMAKRIELLECERACAEREGLPKP